MSNNNEDAQFQTPSSHQFHENLYTRCIGEQNINQSTHPTDLVIFIHGLFGSSRMWLDFISTLENSRPNAIDRSSRVVHYVLVDLLGHGNSPYPNDERDYSLERHVASLLRVIDSHLQGVCCCHRKRRSSSVTRQRIAIYNSHLSNTGSRRERDAVAGVAAEDKKTRFINVGYNDSRQLRRSYTIRHVPDSTTDTQLQSRRPRLHIVGYSLGTILAVELARRRYCETLVLLCTPWFAETSLALRALRAHSFWMRHEYVAAFMCKVVLCKQRWFWRRILPRVVHTRAASRNIPTAVIEDSMQHSFLGVRSTTEAILLFHRPSVEGILAARALIVNGALDTLCFPEGHDNAVSAFTHQRTSTLRHYNDQQFAAQRPPVVTFDVVVFADGTHLLPFTHTSSLVTFVRNAIF